MPHSFNKFLFIIFLLCQSVVQSEALANNTLPRLNIGSQESVQLVEKTSIMPGLTYYQLDFAASDASIQPYTAGNFEISILKVEPSKYQGIIQSALAHNVIKRTQTVSKIAKQANADAAVNGGFFVYKREQGTPGDPAGVSVIDGQLVSEAVINRPALLIEKSSPYRFKILKDVVTKLSISIGAKTLTIDGINRRSGLIFNCGYVQKGDVVKANHDVVCQNKNEIIIYDKHFGQIPPAILKDHSTFWVNENGGIYFTSVNTHPVTVPAGHYLVTASGHKQALLKQYKKEKTTASVQISIYDNGKLIEMRDGLYIINGGPTLLMDGANQDKYWAIQGWDPSSKRTELESLDIRDVSNVAKRIEHNNRTEFFDNWVNQRHPRTAAGVTESGVLFIVVIYGRNPKISVGASIHEMADVMRSLGASDAINLDGGGSSAMYVQGKLTGSPSDPNGERKVADALIFISNTKE
jgi:exopolysaccharide biosynthesis protein